ncbi:mechanosensitive ion channel family protein [Flavobacterium tegetincola]|uniref:mechanosensitive ion channel family protein n=1 Tax=Flavobacterium tegetincola TaxID=150172 RepID=UPI000413E0CB|nr:mechanosensitive ion channel family protein [Flavobacterium tegetincola]
MDEKITELLNDPTVGKIVGLIIGTLIIWLIVQFVQKKFLVKIQDNQNRYRASKIGSFAGYFLTFILILFIFSSKLSGISTALGVAGAGVAFALQEVIASFAGWLAIMLGSFFRTGDRVQLGGIKGDVMDIGVLRTTIMETGQWVDGDLYNGRIVMIANSYVFKEPVFNYSGDFPFLWDEIKLPIQYGSDYDLTTAILNEIGKDILGELPIASHENWINLQRTYRLEDAQTEPMVSLVANDNWVEFTLRYVVPFKKRRMTKTALFTAALKRIEATNGAIKFASATFQLVDSPDFIVNIKK